MRKSHQQENYGVFLFHRNRKAESSLQDDNGAIKISATVLQFGDFDLKTCQL